MSSLTKCPFQPRFQLRSSRLKRSQMQPWLRQLQVPSLTQIASQWPLRWAQTVLWVCLIKECTQLLSHQSTSFVPYELVLMVAAIWFKIKSWSISKQRRDRCEQMNSLGKIRRLKRQRLSITLTWHLEQSSHALATIRASRVNAIIQCLAQLKLARCLNSTTRCNKFQHSFRSHSNKCM